MNKSDKILVTGASGMVGSAIIRILVKKGFDNIIGTCRSSILDEQKKMPVRHVKIDLTDQASVTTLFKTETPAHIFLAAAKVGGIHANNTLPAQFIYDNTMIQSNIIHSAYTYKAKRLLFLGSSCIYPKMAPQPIKEEYLLTGLLEPTNEPYAIAKIAGIKMCESYNRQYNTRFISVMPTNLYGPNDNFDLETSHVMPALIRKFHEAMLSGSPAVSLWGTGTPMREFLHVDDMADACIYIMSLPDIIIDRNLTAYPSPCFINLGTGTDCTIRELALAVQEVTGYTGRLFFDDSMPDGTPRKLLDVGRLNKLGWGAGISLQQGIRSTYDWFVKFKG